MNGDAVRDGRGRFVEGTRPGPGRPRGTGKNQRWLSMLEEHGDEILRVAVEMAKAGDQAMLRLCLERMLPALKAVEHSGGFESAMPAINLTVTLGPEMAPLVDEATLSRAQAGDEGALAELGRMIVGGFPSSNPETAG